MMLLQGSTHTVLVLFPVLDDMRTTLYIFALVVILWK